MNTVGGFTCQPCPPGLWGAPLAGTGLDYAKTHKQVRTNEQMFEGQQRRSNLLRTYRCGQISLIINGLPQECVDVDECLDLPDACVSNSVCVNTVVSSASLSNWNNMAAPPVGHFANTHFSPRVHISAEDVNLVSSVTKHRDVCPDSRVLR